MQANYPKKLNRTNWDHVHITYPVRKHPTTGVSSETTGRHWRPQPEVLKNLKEPVEQLKEYLHDYNVTKQLNRPQTTEDYGFKLPETKRHNKHTSCLENEYIYPPSRKGCHRTHKGMDHFYPDPEQITYSKFLFLNICLAQNGIRFQAFKLVDRVPQLHAHGTTEARSAYIPPVIPPRLVTDKDQYRHPANLFVNPLPEPSWHKELEPLDTTYEGYEKHLDPYLTTSRLHHRPYTADQLERESNKNDVATYYTYKDMPWTRTPKPKVGEWWLPLTRPKSMYDREKFKEDCREIRTHNKLRWVPGSFRTESRDNYVQQTTRPESAIHNFEEEVRTYYQRSIANLQTNVQEEYDGILKSYATEGKVVGSRKPLCSVFEQHVEQNKRLERMSMYYG